MDHFIDVKLLPDPEFPEWVLMRALHNKLHQMLARLNKQDVGISFPGYDLKPKTLGAVMRLHGRHSSLSEVLEAGWLLGMRDYIAPAAIEVAPEARRHLLVKRKQYKTNVDRLRRRRMKRKAETWEQVCKAIPDQQFVKSDLPFISLQSQSTEQVFNLFIEQLVASEKQLGVFSSYGLSLGATVPSF
jgi:CRISPR-associated endonuclease Csy4